MRMETWFRTELRRRLQRQWITWVLLTLGLLAWAAYDAGFWRNFFAGPQTVTPAQMSAMNASTTVPARYFLHVTGSQIADTGVRDLEESHGTTHEKASYYAMSLGDRVLIVRSEATPGTDVTGDLQPIPESIAALLFQGDGALPEASTYPLLLDADGFRARGYIALTLGAVWAVLLVFFGLRSFRRAQQDITLHPAVARVEAWPDSVSTLLAAERELAGVARFDAHGVILTDHFILQRGFFVFNVYRIEDLLWTYQRITSRRIYYVIPAGKTYEAVMNFEADTLRFRAKAPVVIAALEFLAARAPQAIVGFSKDVNKLWRKQRGEFAQLAAQNRGGTTLADMQKATRYGG
jgi:hypothetical protein